MATLLDVFLLWSLVGLVALVGLPLTAFLFARLPGAALGLARPLGLLVVAYPVWLLASLRVVPYARWSMLIGLGILAALSAAVLREARPRLADVVSLRSLLVGEAVFSVAFFGWVLMRSFAPDVLQTEKPMDMAFVNALNRSESFPPHDPWFAGETLNYYYFGHYVVALLVRTAGVDPATAYNLGVALFYALVASSLFAVTTALVLAARGAAARLRTGIVAGLLAVVFAVVLGNLAGSLELLERNSLDRYDWWGPSRVIEGTANEFPFFSFLLGDLHAHVMATPFALLALAIALQIALAGPRLASGREGIAGGLLELLLVALALGALYATNTLDFPTALVLVLGGVVLWNGGQRGRSALVAPAWFLAVAAAALLLFAPFLFHFSPDVKGIALVEEHQPFTALIRDLALIYALPLWVIGAAFVHRLGHPNRYLAWAGITLLVVLVLLAPERLAGLFLVLTAVAVAVYAALDQRLDTTRRFFWLLVATGLSLVAVGDFAYIRDAFEGTSSYRFNTVFKAGYQAWFLLVIAAACAVVWSSGWLRPRVLLAWRVGLAALVGLLAVYPVAASYSRTQGFAHGPTLDGMRWLEERAPGDAAAIRWLQREAVGSPIVLEAVGADFSPDGHARVSTFTGLPTVLGWGGHEVQWGHDPGRRAEHADTIFRTRSPPRARALLARYDVRYVFVGSLERQAYSPASLRKFGVLGQEVFSDRGTTVYALTRDPAAGPEASHQP